MNSLPYENLEWLTLWDCMAQYTDPHILYGFDEHISSEKEPSETWNNKYGKK